MSNNDNGFARAQAQYDAQLPPEDNREECPDCGGEGTMNNKLGDVEPCLTCKGIGEVDKPQHDQEFYDNNERHLE